MVGPRRAVPPDASGDVFAPSLIDRDTIEEIVCEQLYKSSAPKA